jgi:hypothetical protein
VVGAADFARLGEEIRSIDAAAADIITAQADARLWSFAAGAAA